jgi:hypothetical protein
MENRHDQVCFGNKYKKAYFMKTGFVNLNKDGVSRYLPYILSALVLAVVAYVRIRLLTVPLERDEGEYAYMGQLLLKGIPPFQNAYTMKLPGVSILYSLFMLLFGQTIAGIHLGLLMINATCILLVYILARRLLGRDAAIISCSSYAILSISQAVYGVFAHATHFVVMFTLAGFITLKYYLDGRKGALFIFLSGLCFGVAFTMKQHAALLVAFAFLFLIWRSKVHFRSGRTFFTLSCCLFLLGTIIPYTLIVIWMVRAGTFSRFWFWTVQYASVYASGASFADGIANLKYFLNELKAEYPLWLLAVVGFVILCIRHTGQIDRLFLFGFFCFSFLSICPGLYFTGHYFVMLLPPISMLIGFSFSSVSQFLSSCRLGKYLQYIPLFLMMVAIGYGFYHEKEYLFTLTPLEVSRVTYGANPFPEALQIALYLKEHTSANDRIVVFGSEPEIYFYADRLSATGHIYMYGLMDNQPYAERMQLEMIREIETTQPKYVVISNVQTSWLVQPTTLPILFNWENYYVGTQYDTVGVVDILGYFYTRYLWDDKIRGYTPLSDDNLTVFKRKENVELFQRNTIH